MPLQIPPPPPLPTILQHPPRITHHAQRCMHIITDAVQRRRVVRIPVRRAVTVHLTVLPRRHRPHRHRIRMHRVRLEDEMWKHYRLQQHRRQAVDREAFSLL